MKSIEIIDRVDIYVNPNRDLHGPCAVRAANGDLLLCHQDSNQHHGGDGYVHQWRSTDNGSVWQDEGPVANWRDRGYDALFGEFCSWFFISPIKFINVCRFRRNILISGRRHLHAEGQLVGFNT